MLLRRAREDRSVILASGEKLFISVSDLRFPMVCVRCSTKPWVYPSGSLSINDMYSPALSRNALLLGFDNLALGSPHQNPCMCEA